MFPSFSQVIWQIEGRRALIEPSHEIVAELPAPTTKCSGRTNKYRRRIQMAEQIEICICVCIFN